ncbi:hypothetical protein PHISP_05185 [Aspergillus sp. HF37]|nr:hypothetical protein PHISP_05185 [Aspergillus sp. HF37]
MHLSTIVAATTAALAATGLALPMHGGPYRALTYRTPGNTTEFRNTTMTPAYRAPGNTTEFKNTTTMTPVYRAPSNTTEFKNTTTMTPGHSRHPPPKAVPPVYHAPVQAGATCPVLCALHAEACAAAMPFEGDYW